MSDNPLEERVAENMNDRVALAILVVKYASADVDDTLLDAAQAVLIAALAPEKAEDAAPPAPPANPTPYNPSTMGWTCAKCGQWAPHNGFHSCPNQFPHLIIVTYGTTSNPGPVQSTPTACTNGGDLGAMRVTSCFGMH